MITSTVRPNGIRLSIMIGEAPGGGGFEIHHILENNGKEDWVGALWAIICVPRSAQILASCNNKDVHFWPGTDPGNWLHIDKHMTIKPGNFRGKAGWHNENVWLAAIQPQEILIIHNPESTLPVDCVDKGSNLEIFVCDDFAELETLSKSVVIPSGGSAQHEQHWRLFAPFNLPKLI